MMLWKFFKRKKKDQKPVNTFGQDLNKLIDGKLPFGWVVKFKDYYQPKDSKMTELALSIKGKNGQERIAALQTLIKYFYSYKEECKLKGECFEKYFDNNKELVCTATKYAINDGVEKHGFNNSCKWWIRNESDYNLARIDLKIYFKDSSGKTVDYKETSESALCANGEKPFTRYSFSKKDIVNVGVEVSGVSIKE